MALAVCRLGRESLAKRTGVQLPEVRQHVAPIGAHRGDAQLVDAEPDHPRWADLAGGVPRLWQRTARHVQVVVAVPAGVVVIGDDLLVVGVGDPVVVAPNLHMAGEGGVQLLLEGQGVWRPSVIGCSESQTAW